MTIPWHDSGALRPRLTSRPTCPGLETTCGSVVRDGRRGTPYLTRLRLVNHACLRPGCCRSSSTAWW
jgi:hypothetical protein